MGDLAIHSSLLWDTVMPISGVYSMLQRDYKGKRLLYSVQLKMMSNEHSSCDLLYFEPHLMCLQFIKSKPHSNPRRLVCIILCEQIGKWSLGEIK